MKFYSTGKSSPDVDFKTALFQGQAPDGGLYMPVRIPKFTREELTKLTTLEYVSYMVMRKWMTPSEIADERLKLLVKEAFSFPIPLVPVGKFSVLELFHGPTMAFKDIAARVLARLLDYYLKDDEKTATVLVATSGDTGAAIAQAFSGMKRVRVIVLYPAGKVSELQEEQLTRVAENVLTIAVDGVFDDCQSFMKKAFKDPDLEPLHLTTANSINIGRLLPQIIYYVWAYMQSKEKTLRFVVPSGNMGNATAVLLARKMGLPVSSLVIATNENDIAVKYFQTGIYQSKKSVRTFSTAMDIGSPNNFERILALCNYNHDEFRKFITAVKITDAETIYTIKKVYAYDHYLLDFHTAVGYSAAVNVPDANAHTVVVSTASPAKFAKEMKEETEIDVDNAAILTRLKKKEKRVIHSASDYEAIKKIIREKLG